MPKNNQLLPLYTATKSLNVKYTFDYGLEGSEVAVSGAYTHARLYQGYNELLDTRSELGYTDLEGVNFATAAVTFLYTDTTTEEGYLGQDIEQTTVDLNVQNQLNRIFCTQDFFSSTYRQPSIASNKALRDQQFNQFLLQRVYTFSEISQTYDLAIKPKPISTPAQLNEEIKGNQFHEHFHHSEQAAMHYLSSTIGIQQLVSTLQQNKARYLYGVVFDAYTVRMLCLNCNVSLVGAQHSHQQGFLHDLSQSLRKARIEPRQSLMLSTRISATKGAREISNIADDKKDSWHLYNGDTANKVFQAENKTLGTKKIANEHKFDSNTYKGAFFLSRSLNRSKLEKKLQAEAKKEAKQQSNETLAEKKSNFKDIQIIKNALRAVNLDTAVVVQHVLEYCGTPKLSR